MDDEHYTEHGGIAVEDRDNGKPVKETVEETIKETGQETVKVVQQKVEIPEILPLRQDKQNCWEYKLCGRQPGGKNAERFGICPVTTADAFDGLHGGTNAGRACWAVAVPLADTDNKGGIAAKIKNCTTCSFHQLVINQETEYQSAVQYLKKSKEEEKAKVFKEPSFIKHIYEKSKRTAFDDSFEVNSIMISLLIGWVSMCPSVSMLADSKRLCKDDLVDELMVIDAIADNPRSRALNTVAKTMLKAVRRQVSGYFDPLVKIIKK
ncbi:hypothetical protein MBAV_001287 [Candidatus Magnetobacterium bavaricum]|uniref:Uncharacterized protein n=1 Tax=Candidatus Magnetobacterium bavaricum TaxID=29290 RepID=A0A0F3GX93_9BACT|nr:hypothetical protein MBAV_001287 [Candidatus Magnetobacterium bavaricum]